MKMEPVDYMFSINGIRSDISRKYMEIEELRSTAISTGAKISGERVQSSGNGDKTSGIIARIVDAEKELREMEETYCSVLAAMQEVINEVDDDDLRLVLTFRMIGRMSGSRSTEELRIRTGRIIQERQERRMYREGRRALNNMRQNTSFLHLKEILDKYIKKHRKVVLT